MEEQAAEAAAPHPPPLPPPQQRQQRQQSNNRKNNKKRRAAAPLSADEAAEFVRGRAAAHGPERINLKGRELDGPAAVRAVCDAILSFSHPPPAPAVTTTLNLVRVVEWREHTPVFTFLHD